MNLTKIDTIDDYIRLIDAWVDRKNWLKSIMQSPTVLIYDKMRASTLYIQMIRRITQLEKFKGKIDLNSLFY